MNGNGSILAVGSTLYGVTSSSSAIVYSGRARVFSFNDDRGEWEQMGNDLVGEQNDEYCGYSVSLNEEGNILAVGCYQYSLSSTALYVGRTLVFSYNGSYWLPLGNEIVGEQNNEQCGASVSLSANGTVLSVGCKNYDASSSLTDVGRTVVYFFNGTMWIVMGTPVAGSQAVELCGWSISLNAAGTVVAIGCYYYDVSLSNSTLVDAGRAQVYSYNGTEWVKMGDDIVGTQAFENFGYSLSLNADGRIVAAGSIGYNVEMSSSSSSLLQAGRVRVYEYNGNSAGWNILGSPLNGSQAEEKFGVSVALNRDGSKLVVGAYLHSIITPSLSNAGRALVYNYNHGIGWLQWGVDIMGTTASEQAGSSVSLSYDGNQEVKKVGGEEVVASSASCRWSRKVSVAPMTMPREGVEFSSEEREGLKARVVRSAESVGGEEHLPIQAKTEAGGGHVNGDVGESSTAGADIDVGGLVYDEGREVLVAKESGPAVEVMHEEECSELTNVCVGHEDDSCFLHEEVHVGGSEEEEEEDLTISFLFSDYSSCSRSRIGSIEDDSSASTMEEISLDCSSHGLIELSVNDNASDSKCSSNSSSDGYDNASWSLPASLLSGGSNYSEY
eukprot:gene7537-8334_t